MRIETNEKLFNFFEKDSCCKFKFFSAHINEENNDSSQIIEILSPLFYV